MARLGILWECVPALAEKHGIDRKYPTFSSLEYGYHSTSSSALLVTLPQLITGNETRASVTRGMLLINRKKVIEMDCGARSMEHCVLKMR